MKIFTPPTNIIESFDYSYRVFLAGTIDMGNSRDWQKDLIRKSENLYPEPDTYVDIAIYNPRREDWNSSWEQDIDNVNFRQQVEWELLALKHATHIFFNFLPGSQSPITLLELGLFARANGVSVCCPKEFHRSGNVHIICEQYGIRLVPEPKTVFDIIKS